MKTLGDVTIIRKKDLNCFYYNLINDAYLNVFPKGFFYKDPVGNIMISYPCTIQINSKVFQLEKMGDQIKLSNGTRYIMMPIEQVQEIANKTFYDKGQFRTVDFLTLIITEENK